MDKDAYLDTNIRNLNLGLQPPAHGGQHAAGTTPSKKSPGNSRRASPKRLQPKQVQSEDLSKRMGWGAKVINTTRNLASPSPPRRGSPMGRTRAQNLWSLTGATRGSELKAKHAKTLTKAIQLAQGGGNSRIRPFSPDRDQYKHNPTQILSPQRAHQRGTTYSPMRMPQMSKKIYEATGHPTLESETHSLQKIGPRVVANEIPPCVSPTGSPRRNQRDGGVQVFRKDENQYATHSENFMDKNKELAAKAWHMKKDAVKPRNLEEEKQMTFKPDMSLTRKFKISKSRKLREEQEALKQATIEFMSKRKDNVAEKDEAIKKMKKKQVQQEKEELILKLGQRQRRGKKDRTTEEGRRAPPVVVSEGGEFLRVGPVHVKPEEKLNITSDFPQKGRTVRALSNAQLTIQKFQALNNINREKRERSTKEDLLNSIYNKGPQSKQQKLESLDAEKSNSTLSVPKAPASQMPRPSSVQILDLVKQIYTGALEMEDIQESDENDENEEDGPDGKDKEEGKHFQEFAPYDHKKQATPKMDPRMSFNTGLISQANFWLNDVRRPLVDTIEEGEGDESEDGSSWCHESSQFNSLTLMRSQVTSAPNLEGN